MLTDVASRDTAEQAAERGLSGCQHLARFYDRRCESEDECGTSTGTVTDRAMDYFLVARDAKTKAEAWRATLRIDLAFRNDF